LGLQKKLKLGSLDGRRDWGYAPDYTDAMWRMLQQPEPEDYVLATGAAHSIRDFLSAAFEAVELDWREYVEQDPRYMRPAEVTHLVGNASKAESKLGWKAATTLNDLAERMVRHDLQLYSNQARQDS